MNLYKAKQILEQRKGRKIELEDSIEEIHNKIHKAQKKLKDLEKVHEILKTVGLQTQQQLRFHIADVTSIALESVFNEPYKVVLDFVDRRGRSECDIIFERNGQQVDPMTASGGGVVDVAAFALRIASWTMQVNKTRNTIVLDEPFRYLSKDLHSRAGEMLDEISSKLGIQFIIITHEPLLGQYANKVFEVTQTKGVSHVKES